jgi:hypothetical protein
VTIGERKFTLQDILGDRLKVKLLIRSRVMFDKDGNPRKKSARVLNFSIETSIYLTISMRRMMN